MTLIFRRISLPLSYYILAPLKLSPNVLSILSILSGILAALFFVIQLYVIGSLMIFLWIIFDCADGEVARLTDRKSASGEMLETLNSNIQYIIWLPSIAYGLYAEEMLSVHWVIIAMLSTALYNVTRKFYGGYPKNNMGEPKNIFMCIIACQFKNMGELREKYSVPSYIYYIWRNILTQLGVFGPTIFVIAIYDSNLLPIFVSLYALLYLTFSIITFIAICVTSMII